jgi:YggT family protein
MGYFFGALAALLNVVFNVLLLIVLVNALLSWVRPNPSNPIVHFLEVASDMLCNPVRKLFPTIIGGFDIAPMIVMLVLFFLQSWLVPWMRSF